MKATLRLQDEKTFFTFDDVYSFDICEILDNRGIPYTFYEEGDIPDGVLQMIRYGNGWRFDGAVCIESNVVFEDMKELLHLLETSFEKIE